MEGEENQYSPDYGVLCRLCISSSLDGPTSLKAGVFRKCLKPADVGDTIAGCGIAKRYSNYSSRATTRVKLLVWKEPEEREKKCVFKNLLKVCSDNLAESQESLFPVPGQSIFEDWCVACL